MINFHKGDMFKLLDDYSYNGLFCVTTNGYINKRKELVMGRGAAYELKKRFDRIPSVFARLIEDHYRMGMQSYYLVYTCQKEIYPYCLGAFQVKFKWSEPASLYLIEKSSQYLNNVASKFSRVDLNFPGIGNGKRVKREVLPILERELTADNIHIWELQ